jgi:tripartite-type tricarboxylate transporter receptor subunit TctC
MRFIRSICLALLAALLPLAAGAAYPDQPIRIIVPWAPGGTADFLGRLVADKLSVRLKQSVIVENKPGAAGNIGAYFVARAKPDGYTLLVNLMNTHTVNPALYRDMPFRGVDDFTPIALLGYVTITMVINPSLPVHSVAEFIAYAKAHPGKLAYATAGVGTSTHLDAAVFAQMAGLDMVNIPFKGGNPALQDTIAGRTQVQFSAANLTLPQVKAGKLRLLATTGAERAQLLPDVPTVGETVPGYAEPVWYGFFGPPNMPPDITNELNKAILDALNEPAMHKQMTDLGIDVVNDTPEQFGELLHKDLIRYTKIVHDMGLKAE